MFFALTPDYDWGLTPILFDVLDPNLSPKGGKFNMNEDPRLVKLEFFC